MKKLLKSSSLALCSHSRADIPAFVKAGLAFLKENGYDAADMGLHAYGLTRENWEERVESFQKSAEEVGIPMKICHLPFFSGDVAVNPIYREMRDEKISVAIDAPADIINALSGKIGRLKGVTSKVAYAGE